ncbi:MAG: DUF4349 domain-containing protein [Chitinophagaceae bacterium]
MNPIFKKRFWQLSKWFGLFFFLLFVFRIFYGYIVTDTGNTGDVGTDFFGSIGNLRKNYASEKMGNGGDIQQRASNASNQKYEKTASVRTKSSEFESDEKKIKQQASSLSAIIQYEQNLGNKGNRELHLLIGVNPVSFDSFYNAIQHIGNIKSTEIVKVDKTNEYRQLNAKKSSLEKTLSSLNELKSKGGAISDYVSLHDKILEIETRLQELGVELGNFDTENEFCTVKVSLYEGATERKISFLHRVKVALEWAIYYFGLSVLSLFGMSCTIFILLLIAEKVKIFNTGR